MLQLSYLSLPLEATAERKCIIATSPPLLAASTHVAPTSSSCRLLAGSRPRRDQLALQLSVHEGKLVLGKVEEVLRQGLGAADARVLISEVVKEGMSAALQARWSQLRVVDQQLGDVVHRIGRGPRAEDLVPGMRLDLRELELCVVRIHRHELFAGGRAQHLDDLHQLVHPTFSREDRVSQDELSRHTGHGPDVDHKAVVRCAENELWCTIVARADVSHVRLALHQWLGRAEVTDFQGVRVTIHQQVLRLDVSVANAHRVDVCTSPGHLVGEELDKDVWHRLLHLCVVLHDSVNGI
mmetsp:Transcript_83043/g.199297  ORF Transcript_83043/g.199297 Transcript_83043/m.199297 type:complete len:296 (+) Transcript_83043:89-976(+)